MKKRDKLMSAADRGVVDEIILALNTLGEEKMISYDKEIEWLIKLKDIMKELSIEEKAKAYDNVREKIAIRFGSNVAEEIFSEFEESNDERIRKKLIKLLRNLFNNYSYFIKDPFYTECIAWLEKQGQQEEPQVYETEDGEIITYSETDGYKVVEPKFKVGDWILYSGDHYEGVRHITKIDENGYYIERNGLPHGIIPFNHEICMRLWTIQDANDGDVVVEDSNISSHSSPFIAIFKTKDSEDDFSSHCFIGFDGYFYDGEVGHCSENIHPATKEQRDLLFSKMKEAGYMWDAEKKELKKIEQKPTDEEMKTLLRTEYEKGRADAIAEIQNHAWSEEDESYLNTTIAYLKDAKEFKKSAENCINWLKSLKDRVQPRRRHTIFDEII